MTDAEKTAENQTVAGDDPAPLRPELQPIAERYGRDLFDAALRLASLTAAVDQLLHRTRTSPHLHGLVNVIMAALGDLNSDLITAKGWHLNDLADCIAEIGKAGREAGPRIEVPH